MKKIKSSLVLFTCLLVVSCTTLVQQGSYTSPDLSEKGKYSEIISKNFDDTWTAVIDFVSTSSFSIDNFEKDSGLITLSFGASNPGRYIDCGSFTTSGSLDFDGSYVDYINDASRQGSSLTGKMNISIRSISDGNTNVRVNARYIWIAGINSPTSNTFNFDTGDSATIFVSNPTIGTIPTRTCLPTYYAESSVIDFVKSL
jgi:hypothetical protein